MTQQVVEQEKSGQVALFALFLAFLKVGLLSFGGGLSGWIYRETVTRRQWLSKEDFFAGLTVAQIVPGANVANITVYVGHSLRGAVGAATALAGLLVGPFFAVIGLAYVYSRLEHFPGFADALDGVAASAVGLMLVVALEGAKTAFRRVSSGVAFAAIFVAVGILNWPLVPAVLVVGVLSTIVAW